jgi:hypothetical protein
VHSDAPCTPRHGHTVSISFVFHESIDGLDQSLAITPRRQLSIECLNFSVNQLNTGAEYSGA